MIDRVKMPISMGASNHSLGIITFCDYKRNIDEIGLTIQVGAGSNSRSVRIDDETRLEFAHWGCGTSLGIPTHLSAKFLIIPENMIPDRFDNFSDKQKRPVLGLFCPFMAQKPIFLYVFWKKNRFY